MIQLLMSVNWRGAVILSAVISIVFIAIPLVALAFDFGPLQPVHAKDFPVTDILQGSSLLITHVSGLTSLLSAGLDILMDIGAQNDAMSIAVRLKERIVVFLGLAVFGAVFLSFRYLDCIIHMYVAANSFKNITLISAVYSAIYLELCCKKDPFLLFGVTLSCVFWMFMNVVDVYSVYYNTSTVPLLVSSVQSILYLLLVISMARWVQLVRRQNGGRFQMNLLNVEEYTLFQYTTPTLLYPLAIVTWNIIFGNQSWQKKSATTLIYYICINCVVAAVIIVVPGRTARMIAELNRSLLSLKQIFVRYVSHEIRSPLNIVHAGLDIVRSEIEASSGGPVVFISPETAKMIRNMFSASETAIQILNDLLHYEHIDAGTFKLELAVHPLMHFLGKDTDWAKMLAEDKNIDIIVEDSTAMSNLGAPGAESKGDIEQGSALAADLAAQQDAYLNVDIYRMDQVVRNLVTNAVKFTPTNGTVSIKYACEFLDAANQHNIISRVGVDAVGLLRVDVTDSGVGIDLEDQGRVFGEFNQFNRNDLQGGGGSGLGLWISRRIVHMHKGQMGFSSAGRDQGSTFYFELPLYNAASIGLDPEQAARTMLLSHGRHSATPMAERRPTESTGEMKASSKKLSRLCSGEEGSASSEGHAGGETSHALSAEFESSAVQGLVPDSTGDLSIMVGSRPDADHSTATVTPIVEAKIDDDQLELPIAGDDPKPVRFLLVDDSAMNRKVMARIVSGEQRGRLAVTELLEADDGISAVETLRSEMAAGRTVDFVLMDFVMIKLHGPDAAAVMRTELRYSGPIIGVTGNALPEDIARFVAHGADEVVLKPLTKSKLLDAISRYMQL